MGTFAETHRLPFIVCRPRKTCFLFCFRLQQINGGCRFPLVPFSVFGIPATWRPGHGDMETWRHGDAEMETWKHGDMETETWKHGYMDMETWKHFEIETSTENGSPVSLIRLPFAHHANGSLSFVRLMTKKLAEVIRLQTD
jgi:hypothetical protein